MNIARTLFLLLALTVTPLGAATPTVPLLFLPGFAASAPKEGTVREFTFHRGVLPQTLQLSTSYAPLVRSLKSAGYVEGETFFGAVYDWRMLAAPFDGTYDGTLSQVTATSITSGSYTHAINYVGYWLDQAVQANNDVEYVDVVTHSTGGILARAYVQSAAYGAAYVDQHGVTRHLPKIRHLILGADINEGTIHSWRPWQGNYEDVLDGFIPTTEIEGRFAALAFAYVSFGGTISGPDHKINRAAILKLDKDGKLIPDATTFFRLYVPMRQSLMPTSAFLQKLNATTLVDINSDPAVRSDVLLDLNAKSRPGRNPWLKLVGTPTDGGVIATYATGAREKTQLRDFIVPGLVNQNPYISTVIGIDQLGLDQGTYLPLLDLLLQVKPTTVEVATSRFPRIGDDEVKEQLAGDGNGPFTSYRSTLGGDPNVEIIQWGNGAPPPGLPQDVVWNRQTDYPVYHDVFFYNPDVRKLVVETLTGEPAKSVPAMTPDEWKNLQKFLEGAETTFTAAELDE